MGACCTIHDANTKEINANLKQQEKIEQSYQKLLFLGPGSSGKSTIFKQLQWLHGDGFDGYNNHDVQELIKQINAQIISQMKDAITHYLSKTVGDIDETLKNAIHKVETHANEQVLTPEIAEAIAYIWSNDTRLSSIFTKNHTKKVLEESTEYFWNQIDRIKATDFIPNKTDIMNIRNRTTGIIEKKLSITCRNFHIFDVGGQKSERRKWIQCFHDVRAIVFVVAISSYNEMMFENDHKNYMVDALELFDKTIHHKMFTSTPVILFLNKKDLFEDKIKELPITACPAFDDYGDDKDPKHYDDTTVYIKDKFEGINDENERKIYTHITCAMDEHNIRKVFDDVTLMLFETIQKAINTIFM